MSRIFEVRVKGSSGGSACWDTTQFAMKLFQFAGLKSLNRREWRMNDEGRLSEGRVSRIQRLRDAWKRCNGTNLYTNCYILDKRIFHICRIF